MRIPVAGLLLTLLTALHGWSAGPPDGEAVTQYHHHSTRDGLYMDQAFSRKASSNLHLDSEFSAAVKGPVYTQPLFVKDKNGHSLMIVATEQNHVMALDAINGKVVWDRFLGPPVPRSRLPCGNIDPLGITGTPVIHPPTRTLYVSAVTAASLKAPLKHLIFSLSLDDGSVTGGWPLDVESKLKQNSPPFHPAFQNQRGALVIFHDVLYVPFGGHFGDCGDYRGWITAVPLKNPSAMKAWATGAKAGGIWAPSGLAADGNGVVAATGNTEDATRWSQGEAILRFQEPLHFSGEPKDFFAPVDWRKLDENDLDLGGSGIVIFPAPGGKGSTLGVALGKNGFAYLLNMKNLGGISNGLFKLHVSGGPIISPSAAYATSHGTYVVFANRHSLLCPRGQSGDLMALKIEAKPRLHLKVAWCALQNGWGAPIVSTTDGSSNFIVWGLGAEGDNRLRGFDGDTGQVIFNGGGGTEKMSGIRHFQTPVVYEGRIYVPSDDRIYAFKP